MNLRFASVDCQQLLDDLLKKVRNQYVNRSLEKYANQKMPIQSIQFFNNTQKQLVFNQTFKPAKTIQSEEKEPTSKHSRHALKFISQQNTKRVSQLRKSAFIQFSIKKQIPQNSITVKHKKHLSGLQKINKNYENTQNSKLIPLLPQNFQDKWNLRKSFELNKRNSNLNKTEQYIDSLRTKKKKIQEAFNSFIQPKIVQEDRKQNEALKKKISNKQLLNLQIVTNYDGEVIPIKKSTRKMCLKEKLLQLPNYRIKTEISSDYPEIQLTNLKTMKPFKTFKNVSSSVMSNESTEKEILKQSVKMVSIFDLKSQKQNISLVISQNGSRRSPYESKAPEKIKEKQSFNLQNLVSSCTRSRRMIQQTKKGKSKVQTQILRQDIDQE